MAYALSLESQLYALDERVWEIGRYDAAGAWFPSCRKALREGAGKGYEVVWNHQDGGPDRGSSKGPLGPLTLRYLRGDIRPWDRPWSVPGEWTHPMGEVSYDAYVEAGLRLPD